jgi:hypothetical protein
VLVVEDEFVIGLELALEAAKVQVISPANTLSADSSVAMPFPYSSNNLQSRPAGHWPVRSIGC